MRRRGRPGGWRPLRRDDREGPREDRHRTFAPDDRIRLSFAPEEVLGPFSRLSPGEREALRTWVEGHDAAMMRGYEGATGRWLGRLLRLVAGAARRAAGWEGAGRRLASRSDRALRTLMSALRRAPEFTGAVGYRALHALRSRLPGAGTLPDLLARHGGSPHDVAVVFARPLAQRPRFRAFWRDAGAHRTVGCILGLDLCPSDDGWYVVESNLEPAQSPLRASIFGERDPFAANLVEHAAGRGYRHLVVVDSRFSGVLPYMARQYRRAAEEAGIRLRLVNRVFAPESENERSYGIPRDLPPATLVARLKHYPVATDYLVGDKVGSFRALSLYADVADDPEPDLRVPAAGPEPVLAQHGPEAPVPNVVMKQSNVDKGKAVRFAKAASPGHARQLFRADDASIDSLPLRDRLESALRRPRYVFQEFIRPALLEGRRPYKVRALMLVSPDGPVFLSAHRVVSHQPAPELLPQGLVEDPGTFMVSRSFGGADYARVPAEELPGVRRATLAAGRGFAWALRESFVCGPEETAEEPG